MGKIFARLYVEGNIKIILRENVHPLLIFHKIDFEKYFPNADLSPSDWTLVGDSCFGLTINNIYLKIWWICLLQIKNEYSYFVINFSVYKACGVYKWAWFVNQKPSYFVGIDIFCLRYAFRFNSVFIVLLFLFVSSILYFAHWSLPFCSPW